MNSEIRRLFEDNEFKKGIFYIQGYDIHELGKGKASNPKFRGKTDLPVDWDIVTDAIAEKGKVYYFTKKKDIKSFYIVRNTGSEFICNNVYYSSDLEDSLRELMDRQVIFLMAERAHYMKDMTCFFNGMQVPKLNIRSGNFNWSMGICFALIYGVLFSTAILHNPAGWLVGAAFGFCMGMCMKEHFYEYEKTGAPDIKEASDEAETI